MKIYREGTVWKYGDDVNTDGIFPGRYVYTMMSEEEMGRHALEDLDLNFTNNAKPGEIIVAGSNWGCGSSREQAVKCLKARGVGAIVASGFSRIFYRNSINEGLPVAVCPEAAAYIKAGDTIQIDFEKGTITDGDATFTFSPYPEYVAGIVQCGGLVSFIKQNAVQREN